MVGGREQGEEPCGLVKFFWFEEYFHIAVVEVCEFFCSLFKLFWVVTAARALLEK